MEEVKCIPKITVIIIWLIECVSIFNSYYPFYLVFSLSTMDPSQSKSSGNNVIVKVENNENQNLS